MFEIGKLTKLPLGMQGENKARTIQINMKDWLEDWPGAAIVLTVKRPGDSNFYPADIDLEGNVLSWTLTRADVANAGEGEAQLVLKNGDDVELRSRVVRTVVEASLSGTLTDAPAPEENWITNVLATGETAKLNAKAAADSASVAVAAAEETAGAAEEARQHSENADAKAAAAATSEANAVQAAETATAKAGEAAEAKNAAEYERNLVVGLAVEVNNRANAAKASQESAQASADAASVSAGNASSYEQNAAASANESASSARKAENHMNSASSYASTASQQASIATSKASVADNASVSATQSAATATAKASESASSANEAKASAAAAAASAAEASQQVVDVLVVHVDSSYKASRTADEIRAAAASGRTVLINLPTGDTLTYSGTTLYGNTDPVSVPYFTGAVRPGSATVWVKEALVVPGNVVVTRHTKTYTSSPYKLTFTGAANATYDGSSAVTVSIPVGGGSGGLPETADPLKQLVTDADGNVAWEDRLAYKITTTGEVVNLEETVLTYDEEDGSFFLLSPWVADPMVGAVATVTYNGMAYECNVVDGNALQPDAPVKMVVMGNLAAMGLEGVEGSNPNAPFALIALPHGDLTEGLYAMLVPLDGATAVTLSVTSKQTQTTVKTIDPEYLGKKTITITVNDDGSYTSDTPFEEAWEMTPAELQSSIVIIAKPDAYNGNRQYTVQSVGKTEGNIFGANGIQLRVMNAIPMDVSDSNIHDAVHYIDWTAGGISKVGTMPLLPRVAYAGNYLRYNGYTWYAVQAGVLASDITCVVNVTLDGSGNVTACDKTYAEVAEAIAAGKDARAVVKNASSAAMFLRLALTADNTIAFNGTWITGSGADAMELAYNFVMTASGTNTFEQRTF